jgi:hypothetical protein
MPSIKLFSEMSMDEKLDFFQRCQDLLVKNQPKSPYILKSRRSANKKYFMDILLRYKGIAYQSERMAMLFNKHHYSTKEEIHEQYEVSLFPSPHPNPNSYSVDFITSTVSKELLEEVRPFFPTEGIEYIFFLRGQKISVFDAKVWREGLFSNYGLKA